VLANLIDKPHDVRCKNHKLNLEVNKMMREVPGGDMEETDQSRRFTKS
jgi:hypothetical protein